jgi:putative transposase
MVERWHKKLSIKEQCTLLNICHSGFYYVPARESERNLSIMAAIDKIHTECPFYGFRRIQIALQEYGFYVGKKMIIRFMKLMAIFSVPLSLDRN